MVLSVIAFVTGVYVRAYQQVIGPPPLYPDPNRDTCRSATAPTSKAFVSADHLEPATTRQRPRRIEAEVSSRPPPRWAAICGRIIATVVLYRSGCGDDGLVRRRCAAERPACRRRSLVAIRFRIGGCL